MGKDYFQDITPPGSNPLPVRKLDQTLAAHESRSIREISVERTSRPRIDEGNSFVAEKVPSNGMGRVVLWAGAGVGLALLGIAIVLMFRPSTVTVIPRSHTVTFSPDARLVITPRTLGASGLAFDPVSITLEESSSLPAEGTTAVREFATGSLTIQNTFSDTPVKLIENTRFESTEGRIYRIAKAVSVPGKKGSIPGTLTVTVRAEEAGEAYNIGLSTFKLPGLKNNAPMYSGVTARSGAPMSGGFTGTKPKVDTAAVQNARAELRIKLEAKAREQLKGSTSSMVFPSLLSFSYQSKPETAENGQAKITESVTATYPSFVATEFAQAVGSIVSADALDASVSFIPGADFILKADETLDLTNPSSIALQGTGRLLWSVSEEAVRAAVAGKEAAIFTQVMESVPSVQEAHYRIQPFWKSSFPTSLDKIIVYIDDILAQ